MKLVTYPSPVLKSVCSPVDFFDDSLARLIDQMKRVMYQEGGVGLAAPQVGIDKQILVMDPMTSPVVSTFKALINPRIIWSSSEIEFCDEGCLSLPGTFMFIPRSKSVEVEYCDPTGRKHKSVFSGFEARIVQHEMDHLVGMMMPDRLQKEHEKISYSNF